MTQAPDPALSHAVDDFVGTLVAQGKGINYFKMSPEALNTQCNMVGSSLIVAPQTIFLMAAAISRNYILREPHFVNGVFYNFHQHHIIQNKMCSKKENMKRRMISDPDAAYPPLIATAALALKEHNTGAGISPEEVHLWDTFLRCSPTKKQLNAHWGEIEKDPETLEKAEQIKEAAYPSGWRKWVDIILPHVNKAPDYRARYRKDYPGFYAAEQKEAALLQQAYPDMHVTCEPFDVRAYADKPRNVFDGLDDPIGSSRENLLSDPLTSLDMLVDSACFAKTIRLHAEALPVVAARMEFLGNLGGNFVVHALEYNKQLAYQATQGSPKSKEYSAALMHYTLQFNRELGAHHTDLDIATLQRETAILRNAP